MTFDGAVIKEQGVTFAVVVVKPHILRDRSQAEGLMQSFSSAFSGLPVVLMGQDSSGRPTFFGRTDLSRFMSRVPLAAIPWKRYNLNN